LAAADVSLGVWAIETPKVSEWQSDFALDVESSSDLRSILVG
jgi:hypothetical protein